MAEYGGTWWNDKKHDIKWRNMVEHGGTWRNMDDYGVKLRDMMEHGKTQGNMRNGAWRKMVEHVFRNMRNMSEHVFRNIEEHDKTWQNMCSGI